MKRTGTRSEHETWVFHETWALGINGTAFQSHAVLDR